MSLSLSDRLEAVAELVGEAAGSLRSPLPSNDGRDPSWLTNKVVADIGTDHGYLAAALLERGIANGTIACDVNEGPLSRARETLAGYENAEVRLCDGMTGLKPGEADIAVMAGMGGRLMMHIIEDGDPGRLGIRAMVLQPQSEIYEFRVFLRENGFQIVDERSVWDTGKFYQAMLVKVGDREDKEDLNRGSELVNHCRGTLKNPENTSIQTIYDRFGQCGILRGDVALLKYVELRIDKLKEIIGAVPGHDRDRLAELKSELDYTETARRIITEGGCHEAFGDHKPA
ncbi:MAG: class I SAM-dependent methyltransferase [Lachnospiraceae bacterium]|nr:class I SAM-dependent methyltransferase [Lachnospiraceae bacterium]